MKHFISFLVTVVIFVTSFAQNDTRTIDWEWAPIGAVWMYQTANMAPGTTDSYAHYWYVRSVKDTIYKGINCRKLEVIRHFSPDFTPTPMPNRFTYQDGGDIYFYNADIDEFVLSFSYDIQYGDTVTWQMPVFENCVNSFFLDTVFNWEAGFLSGTDHLFTPYGVFMFSNNPINSYKLGYLNNNCWAGKIGLHPDCLSHGYGNYFDFMGIGSDIFELTLVEELVNHCRCYYDGHIKINTAAAYMGDTVIRAKDSCLNYYNHFNNIQLEQQKETLQIYPNPITNNLHINISTTDNYSVEIISLEGKSLYYKTELKNDANINLGHLEPGIYIVSVTTKEQSLSKRIIKI
ncbi:MAG: T9SS type A sorting domain-containing protein [Bacteroidales bacterium]|nr:T9SS type A sorting domain-containing protein [Bacteroidales bacterium]